MVEHTDSLREASKIAAEAALAASAALVLSLVLVLLLAAEAALSLSLSLLMQACSFQDAFSLQACNNNDNASTKLRKSPPRCMLKASKRFAKGVRSKKIQASYKHERHVRPFKGSFSRSSCLGPVSDPLVWALIRILCKRAYTPTRIIRWSEDESVSGAKSKQHDLTRWRC